MDNKQLQQETNLAIVKASELAITNNKDFELAGEIMKSEKLFEMVKSLQAEAGDIGNGFNEFNQVIEDWLFEAIQENYLTPKGKKSLESRIKSCFMLEKNIKKWG